MIGTKANNMADYKSRFETMGFASGSASAATDARKTMQSNAQKFAEKALALGEAAGLGGARVPLVQDAASTMERMMDKFVNNKIEKYGVSATAKEQAKAL